MQTAQATSRYNKAGLRRGFRLFLSSILNKGVKQYPVSSTKLYPKQLAAILRNENSIIPESDLSFDSTAALEKQLRSLLYTYFPSTTVKPKSCVILSGIIKPSLLIICSLFLTANAYAAEVNIKAFQKGSYQSILAEYQGQPFVLILWSVTCSACLDEMELIHNIHQQQPKLNMLMLSVDGPEFYQEMTRIIKQAKLTDLDHRGFAEDNSPALRYAVDSQWYGELPRTYFFNAHHDKTGISGVLSPKKYKQLVVDLLSNE